MASIWTMGEMLVEIMRTQPDVGLKAAADFRGPYPSGAPAIFIDTVARLGHRAGICGGVGEDAFGDCVVERLSAHGVDCSRVGRFPGSTAVAFVAYGSSGNRSFIFHIDGTPAARITADSAGFDPAPDFFHVMGCSLMVNDTFRNQILDLATSLARRGTRISFDPNIRPELLAGRDVTDIVGPLLDQTSVLLPGRAELLLLGGVSDEAAAITTLLERHPIEVIALKRGKAGATIITRGERVDVPGEQVREVDPTGAGDCFDAGFVCAFSENLSPKRCGAIAAACGAANARAFGPMEGDISRALVGFPE